MPVIKSQDSAQPAEEYQPHNYWNEVAQKMKQRMKTNMLTGDDSPFLHLKRAIFLTKFLTQISVKEKVVLEVGSGQGGNLVELAKAQPAKLVGCDVSEAMIEIARYNTCNFEKVDLVQVDGTTLPFQDRSFDITFTSTVLQHNLDSTVTKLLAEICRVTDDRLYLFEDTGRSKRQSFSFVLRPVSEYTELCAAHGFELIETEPLGLYLSESTYRILRVFFRRNHKEGIPISKIHLFLEKAALPFTSVFDKIVMQRRGLTKMVFRRQF
jgi:ubiquinone/menaquinone biosynthesis C-methylase UbiE